jgi:hypothetical protein
MVSNKDIDNTVKRNMKGMSNFQKKRFSDVTDSAWFRSYARNSKEKLNKIIKKVKGGVKHGKYGRGSSPTEELPRGWKKPTPKKAKKEKKNQRKERAQKKKSDFAPSGRKYSYTENHEGRGSKRAKAYRERNDISETDWGY